MFYTAGTNMKRRKVLRLKMWQGTCSCGWEGQFWYGNEGHALLAAFEHRSTFHSQPWLGNLIMGAGD